MQTTTMNRIMTVSPVEPVRINDKAFLFTLSLLPGILCYHMFATHTSLLIIAPFVAFFAYMGIPSMMKVCKSYLGRRR